MCMYLNIEVLILRNVVDDLTFNKSYTEYENGFGNATSGNYWIGLKTIYNFTKNSDRVVRFELQVINLLHPVYFK